MAGESGWQAAQTLVVVGWIIPTVINLFLSKILARPRFHVAHKLQALEIHIIPELNNTLQAVDQERMMQREKRVKTDLDALDKMAAILKHALEDAEDIFDDAQHKSALGCYHRLRHAFSACVALCIVRAKSAWLLQWARPRTPEKPDSDSDSDNETVSVTTGAADSDSVSDNETVPVTTGAAASHNETVPVTTGVVASDELDPATTLWIARIVRTKSARLLQWARDISLSLFLRRTPQEPVPEDTSAAVPQEPVQVSIDILASHGEPYPMTRNIVAYETVPVTTCATASGEHDPVTASATVSDDEIVPVTTGAAASDEPDPVTTGATASGEHDPVTASATVSHHEIVPVTTSAAAPDETVPVTTSVAAYSFGREIVPVTTASNSLSGWWLSCLCSSLDFFKNCCALLYSWLAQLLEAACFCRDRSYEMVGINQENASLFHTLDICCTAISRMKLKKRIQKIENTVSEVKKSPLLGVASNTAPNDIANKNRSKIRTSSKREVFGRKALRDNIMAKLRETSPSLGTSPCYSVIGIYGVAGSGKTTFARYTRDYIEVDCKEERLFDTIMCIHVSETFSVDDIFHEMLKDITKDRDSNISDRGELEKKLKEELRGKRFFLILDDLWVTNKYDSQLQELISPLIAGAKGSKILVTARTKYAAGALGANELIKMPDLGEDQYLDMFMHYALDGTSVPVKEFEQVGREIAKKLHRSPIAAVTVAGRLGVNPNISFWKNVAKLDMLNDTMDALWWSYKQLNPDIRRCFEYCNIFPRRVRLDMDKLVHLWIAQGFVKTSSATEDMEDVAEFYIQELVSFSFLEPEWGYFTIHDLLHDLVDKVGGSDFFRIENEGSQRVEGWKGDVPQDVHHLFVKNYDAELITEKILGLENLRTLIIDVVEEDTPVEEKVIESICKTLPKLRVLAIAFSMKPLYGIMNPNNFSVPKSIAQLKHLRYLALRTDYSCSITLPRALTKLHHIQMLDFYEGQLLEFHCADLVNLRHMFCWPFNLKFRNLGRLISLQTLPCFTVGNEQGYDVKQLSNLNKLRGSLKIKGLENVKSKEEALEANLGAKERIIELTLEWGDNDDTRCNPEVEAEVLQGLCPPVGLQSLDIDGYRGSRYPEWMVGKQSGGPEGLQDLCLRGCKQLGPGPQFEAFPYLHGLTLMHCSWNSLPGNMERLTLLKGLEIMFCMNIRSLPTLPQSIEDIILAYCNDEFVESCKTVGHPNWQKIEHIPSKYLY